MKYGRLLLLSIIVFVAFVLRVYTIGVNPPSLTWDEVAWGYNAYSLGIDGRDEFGRFLPHDYLESFGDFKPPLYAYLTIIPVKLFGLNEFATRLPSAVAGTITVLLTYFLVKAIFNSSTVSNSLKHDRKKEMMAILAAGILAISPWHINLSRAAFEANVATCFLVFGVWSFLYALAKNRWYLCLSAVAFVASMYTFNTSRIVAPILVIGLAIGFYKPLLKYKKETITAAILGLLLIAPIVGFLFSPQAKLRFNEVNIFTDIGVIERSNQAIERDNNAFWSYIVHNRRFLFTIEFMKHYFDNLTPQFLFIHGDGNPKFSTQDVGQMYLWELPFLIIGALFLFKNKEGQWWIIPFWLLIGIIPAATARETPHALRIETTLPTFQMLVAYGIYVTYVYASRFKVFFLRYSLIGILFFVALAQFVYYLHGYYTFYPKEYSGEWQYGYKEAIAFVKENNNRYERVYMTETLGRPYSYFLFYLKHSPEQFRKEAVVEREAAGFVHVRKFDKYYFAKDINSLPKEGSTLYIDVPEEVPASAQVVKTFHLLNGKPALVAYTQ